MKEDIKDTEIRIIGANKKDSKKNTILILCIIGELCIALLVGLVWHLSTREKTDIESGIYEQEETSRQQLQPHPLRGWLCNLDTIQTTGTAIKDSIVNDIPLHIYVPLNGKPRLTLGYDIMNRCDENILFFQAADIRADNKNIVGAFVLEGEVLSRGLSKRGYCAIIDGKIEVGVADNSPLFEEATEKNGYFFRQFPLVDNGILVENTIKTKSMRRGICELEGKIVIVTTDTPESLHDFAQALVDIGTTNAIYLVGSDAIGWACDIQGNGIEIGAWDKRQYKNVNFITWGK